MILKTKVMKKRVLLVTLALIGYAVSAIGQSATDWNWPEDKATAEEKYVLYKDALKQDNYQAAKKPHKWLMENVPNLHNSLYIDGAKIYEGLAEVEKDRQRKIQLQDSALLMYDKRIEYFNDESNVLNRKAFTAYKYYNDNEKRYKELYDMFSRAFELSGNNVPSYIVVPYMDVVRRYKLSTGELTDEEVINIYDEINAILESKQQAGDDRIDAVRENLDKVFMASVDVSCELIQNNMMPKLNQDPGDLQLAKKIMSLMYAAECTDDPNFLKTVKIIYNKEPNYGLAYLIGIKSIQNENFADATKFLKEAIELTEENTKKGEIYIKLGDIQHMQGSKSAARNSYRQALSVDPTLTEAYTKIGDLYMRSFDDCKGGESMAKDRAIYLAAYEMYQKAGNSEGMAKAKAQFPSKEEAFQFDLYAGDTLTIGCWINETVTLRTRD